MAEIPTFDDYMKPMVAALRRLGGSATNNELYEAVVDEMKLSEEQLSLIHTRNAAIRPKPPTAWHGPGPGLRRPDF
jgi:hypothetical protein